MRKVRKYYNPLPVHRHLSLSGNNIRSIWWYTRKKFHEQHKEIPLLCSVFYLPFPTNHCFRDINHFSYIFASLEEVYVYSKIAVLRFLSLDEILWRHVSEVTVLCNKEEDSHLKTDLN